MRLPYNLRMIARALVVLLLLVALSSKTSAGDRKEWVKLTDCHYVDGPDNDGDSFRVRSGDKEVTARLYYVDAPEINLRQGERSHDQSLHFGITLDETMKAGEKAKQRVQELLQKPFLIWTRWATAGGRGRESRYYVIVEIDGKSLGEILVTEGLARTKGVQCPWHNSCFDVRTGKVTNGPAKVDLKIFKVERREGKV